MCKLKIENIDTWTLQFETWNLNSEFEIDISSWRFEILRLDVECDQTISYATKHSPALKVRTPSKWMPLKLKLLENDKFL